MKLSVFSTCLWLLTPRPQVPWYDVVRVFPCSPVTILLATKMLLFPGESKVIQTSSKLVHLRKASSIFVGGPPMFVVIFWKCFFQSSAKGTSREFSTKFGLCGGVTTSQFLEDFPEKQSIESLVWLIQPPFFHHD